MFQNINCSQNSLDEQGQDEQSSERGPISNIIPQVSDSISSLVNTIKTSNSEIKNLIEAFKQELKILKENNTALIFKAAIESAKQKLTPIIEFKEKHKKPIIVAAITVTVLSAAVYLWKKYNNSKKQIIKKINIIKLEIDKLKANIKTTQDSELIEEKLNELEALNKKLVFLKSN